MEKGSQLSMSGAAAVQAVPAPLSRPAGLAGFDRNARPRENPLPLVGAGIKRTLDITLSLIGLLFATPLLTVAMFAVWLETPGSPLFDQVRIGRGGRTFRLLKLRTMVVDGDASAHNAYVASLIQGHPEQHGGMFKLVDDPRVTRVGRFLRRCSIDELPQMWNVLKGDMSLVGPRPPLPYEADLYSAHDRRRLRVKPGITGLWQVNGRATTSFHEMVEMDIAYYESWNIRLELSILAKTPWAVLTGAGAA